MEMAGQTKVIAWIHEVITWMCMVSSWLTVSTWLMLQDKEVQGQMVVSLKNVSMVSSKLLVTAKSVAADPSAPNAKNQLAAAAR